MAKAKTRRKSVPAKRRTTSSGTSAHYHHHRENNSFLLIVCGGFVVIVLVFMMMNRVNVGKSRQLYQDAQNYAETVMPVHQSVTINDQGFQPQILTVTPGTVVTWENRGTVAHSATSDDGTFDTGAIAENKNASYKFTEKGTYSYHSSENEAMTGTIVVE